MTTFDAKTHFRNLKVIHLSLLAGQILILTIFSLFVITEPLKYSIADMTIAVVPITAIVLGIPLSEYLFNLSKKRITNDLSLATKMESYRSAYIMRDAPKEGAAMINILLYAFMDNNIFFLAGAILIMLIFMVTIPSVNATINHLNLSRAEGEQLV